MTLCCSKFLIRIATNESELRWGYRVGMWISHIVSTECFRMLLISPLMQFAIKLNRGYGPNVLATSELATGVDLVGLIEERAPVV